MILWWLTRERHSPGISPFQGGRDVSQIPGFKGSLWHTQKGWKGEAYSLLWKHSVLLWRPKETWLTFVSLTPHSSHHHNVTLRLTFLGTCCRHQIENQSTFAIKKMIVFINLDIKYLVLGMFFIEFIQRVEKDLLMFFSREFLIYCGYKCFSLALRWCKFTARHPMKTFIWTKSSFFFLQIYIGCDFVHA